MSIGSVYSKMGTKGAILQMLVEDARRLILKYQLLQEMLVWKYENQPLTLLRNEGLRFLHNTLGNSRTEFIEMSVKLEVWIKRYRDWRQKDWYGSNVDECGGELADVPSKEVSEGQSVSEEGKNETELREQVLESTKRIWMLNGVLPHISGYLDRNDLLNCRNVCSGWKRQLDDFLKPGQIPQLNLTSGSVRAYMTWQAVGRQLGDIFTGFSFCRQERIREFGIRMEEYSRHRNENRNKGNPFPTRHVSFDGGEDDDYWDNVKVFLDQFGKHIWAFDIIMELNNCLQAQTTIQECLLRLPNLRQLSITWRPLNTAMSTKPDISSCDSCMKSIRKQEPFQFPEMPHLVSLHFDVYSYFLGFAFPDSVCNQLQHMDIESRDLDNLIVYNGDTMSSGFKNLTSLRILVSERQEDWKDLSKITWLKAPLKKLEIIVRISSKPSEKTMFEFHVFLPVLQHFRESLQHVVLEFQWFMNERITSTPRKILKLANFLNLHLPNVKVLELKNNFDSLNFLLCCPSLKHLTLHWCSRGKEEYFTDVREGELIEVYGFVDRMYKSNIWALFPSLQTVDFAPVPHVIVPEMGGHEKYINRGHVYTREEFERVDETYERTYRLTPQRVDIPKNRVMFFPS